METTNQLKYIAMAECVNTYELEVTQEPYGTFEAAVEALLDQLGDEYNYRHHWLCKVLAIGTEGEVHKVYFDRTGTSKPSTDADVWSTLW